MTEALLLAAQLLTWAVCAAAFTFVGLYAVHTWWRTIEGQNLMAVTLIVAVTYGMTGLMPWLRVSITAQAIIACVLLASMLAVIIQRIWLLRRADREARTGE
jgi:hypothetical protein